MSRRLDDLQNKLAEYHLSKEERRRTEMPLDQHFEYRFLRYGVFKKNFDRLVETKRDHPMKSHFLSAVGVILSAFKNHLFKNLTKFHSAVMCDGWHPIQLTGRREYGTRRRTPRLGINLKVVRIGRIVFRLAPMGVTSRSFDNNIRIRKCYTDAQIEDALREHSLATIYLSESADLLLHRVSR